MGFSLSVGTEQHLLNTLHKMKIAANASFKHGLVENTSSKLTYFQPPLPADSAHSQPSYRSCIKHRVALLTTSVYEDHKCR